MISATLLVVANESSDKTIGIMLHDPDSGRVLLKVRPSDQSLMKLFLLWTNKPIIEQVREEIRGKKLTRRIRMLPTEFVYATMLANRVIKPPYQVRSQIRIVTENLDLALDQLYEDMVDKAPAKIEPQAPAYSNPFKSPQ